MRCPCLDELPPPPSDKTGWPWTEESTRPPDLLADGQPWPRISIVTPSYNQGEFIEETIRSVLLQGYPNLEYIIIDRESTDDSLEIIKKYERWLTSWMSERDSGQSDAINKGANQCKGEIINWLNSDDYLMPGALFHVADAYMSSRNVQSLIIGGGDKIDRRHRILTRSFPSSHEETPLLVSMPFAGGVQASWFLTKNLWNAVGGLKLNLHYTMDIDLYLRCALQGIMFIPLPYVLAVQRIHPAAKTTKDVIPAVQEKYQLLSSYINAKDTANKKQGMRFVREEIARGCLGLGNQVEGIGNKLRLILLSLYFYPRQILQFKFWKKVLRLACYIREK